jgi:hypothetical protein
MAKDDMLIAYDKERKDIFALGDPIYVQHNGAHGYIYELKRATADDMDRAIMGCPNTIAYKVEGTFPATNMMEHPIPNCKLYGDANVPVLSEESVNRFFSKN